MQEIKNYKTAALIDVLKDKYQLPSNSSILIVGCGDGSEAAVIQAALGGAVEGIDTGGPYEFLDIRNDNIKLSIMDAHNLEFPDCYFDFAYSFHAIEHVKDPVQVLKEIHRCLKPGGVLALGTPSKRRVIGYIGSATSLLNKIKWNMWDLKMRLIGKWSNEHGAHAGFYEEDMSGILQEAHFTTLHNVTDEYYRKLYKEKFSYLQKNKLRKYAYPCIYFVAKKSNILTVQSS